MNVTEETELLYKCAYTDLIRFHAKQASESDTEDLFFWAGSLMALFTNWQELSYYQSMWECSMKSFNYWLEKEKPKDPRKLKSWTIGQRVVPIVEAEIERIRNKYGILPEA